MKCKIHLLLYTIDLKFVVLKKKMKSDRPTHKSANWRIVIPNLTQYTHATPLQLNQLKCLILHRLKHRPQDRRSHMKSQFDRGLRYYHIALQRHANGVPHLDVLLIYEKSIHRQLVDFDFLLKHGNITVYRKLNAAILAYGKKQDSQALSNLPEDSSQVLDLQDLKSDPYLYLQKQMLKDPLHFNLQQYVRKNDLDPYISGWSSIKTKLKDMQLAAANLTLKGKPGFQFISRNLIEETLTLDQLRIYDSWPGYQTIVDHLNQIVTYGYKRPLKTKNLLITGPASIGKTSLFHSPYHPDDQCCVQDFCSVYPMGMSTWFPKYQSGVYQLILWNQAKLTSYSYDLLLKFLEGSYVDLPTKGGVAPKRDNPLVIMTSNLTIDQMIKLKFNYSEPLQALARSNLSVRVHNVIVPQGYDLFLLQKLLLPRSIGLAN